jgi:hypothetical protein
MANWQGAEVSDDGLTLEHDGWTYRDGTVEGQPSLWKPNLIWHPIRFDDTEDAFCQTAILPLEDCVYSEPLSEDRRRVVLHKWNGIGGLIPVAGGIDFADAMLFLAWNDVVETTEVPASHWKDLPFRTDIINRGRPSQACINLAGPAPVGTPARFNVPVYNRSCTVVYGADGTVVGFYRSGEHLLNNP